MSLENFSKIILDLTKNSKTTVNEISKRTNIPRETTNRIVSNLVKDNLIVVERGNNNLYSLSNVFLNLKPNNITDVYFNFKINNKHKQKIYYLFYKIENKVFQLTAQKPTKTQMQKIIVQINNKLNLNLPIMWYKYGQITPVSYNPELNYFELVNIKITNIPDEEIYQIISENIVEHSKIISSKDFRVKQYYSNDSKMHKLYQLKDKMFENAYNGDFDFLEKNTEKIIKLTPYFKDKYNIINEFYDFIIYFTDFYNKTKDYYLKKIGIEAYTLVWNYIAIHNYVHDMKKYYIANNYDLEELSTNISYKISEIKEKFDEVMARFYEQFNIVDFIYNPEIKELMEKVISDKESN